MFTISPEAENHKQRSLFDSFQMPPIVRPINLSPFDPETRVSLVFIIFNQYVSRSTHIDQYKVPKTSKNITDMIQSNTFTGATYYEAMPELDQFTNKPI